MARKPSAKVVLNRAALTNVGRAIADGFLEVGQTIVEVAAEDAPDSPHDPYPIGEGLPKQGGVLVYVKGQKVAGWSTRGTQPRIDRRTADTKQGITAIAGFGFPGRFAEFGTAHHGAQPFLTPALDRVAPRVVEIMRPIVMDRLGRRP